MPSVFTTADFEEQESNQDFKSEKQLILHNFITSSRAGDLQKVLRLLGSVDNINGCNTKGFSALHAAVLSGNKDLIKVLIEHGADVNLQSNSGITPLYVAVQENLPDVVQLLLHSGADRTVRTKDGATIFDMAGRNNLKSISAILSENESTKKIRLPHLHAAAKKNDQMLAFSLLTDQTGLTALHVAAQYGSDKVAKLLLVHGASVNFCTKGGITPLHIASKWGKCTVADLLLLHGANINCLTNDLLTPIHCCSRSGQVRILDLLLKAGGDLTLKTRSGLTPLHMAAQGDHYDVASLLLTRGAAKDDVTYDLLTPLHVSAHCGSVKVAGILLDYNCLINATALNGFTPLHVACRKNRHRIVELLVRHGVKINSLTESGLTPLHIATYLGHKAIVSCLLEGGADPNIKCLTNKKEVPLHLAAKTNNVEIAEDLIRHGADIKSINQEFMTPLHVACKHGSYDVCLLLLQKASSSSQWSSYVDEKTAEDYTALHYASSYGNEALVHLLLQHGADASFVTKRGFNSIHLAAKSGHVSILEKLLSVSPESRDLPGKNRLTPLHIASHYNHWNAVQHLVNSGANMNAPAKNGYTPLHIAAKRNNLDVAEVLVDNGADINIRSDNGFTPLHLSALEGYREMTYFLLKSGANPNMKNRDGLTPFHVAVQEDWIPIVELFFGNDSLDIDAQTNTGFTALHLSTHYGFLNATKLLLEKGASANLKNKFGNTALHQAVQEGHMHVVEVLLEDKRIDLDSLNGQNFNPIMIAKTFGFNNIERILINKGSSEGLDINAFASDGYVRTDPETTHKQLSDAKEADEENGDDVFNSPGNLRKSNEDLSQDGAMHKGNVYKVQDFLDLNKLMSGDIMPSHGSLSSDLNSYTAHLTYTSPQTPGAFTDDSEVMLCVAETPSLLLTPISATGGLLFDSPSHSPYYSPSFAKKEGEKILKLPDSCPGDESSSLERYGCTVMEVDEGDKNVGRPGAKSHKADKRRETWLGVLETKDFDKGVVHKIEETLSGSQGFSKKDEFDEKILRSERSSSKSVRDRRSYNLAIGTAESRYCSLENDENRNANIPTVVVNKEVEVNKTEFSDSTPQLPFKGFLTSFIVDARGCIAVGGRHSGVRFIIPANRVARPTRVICKLIRSHKLPGPFVLAEGEGHVNRVFKLSSDVSQFEKPILLEMPHFGGIKPHERELCILKSEDDGKTWTEHQEPEASKDLKKYLDDLEPAEQLFDSSVHRVLFNSLPSYLVLISRVKKDLRQVGPEGGVLQSSVCPLVKIDFPQGAVTKITNVGLQVFKTDKELYDSIMNDTESSSFTCSPVVSIEPRCRKFHQPVSVTIPLPPRNSPDDSGRTSSLRLLYNLGNANSLSWTDITESTVMDILNNTATFSTDVSARFWLVDAKDKEGCLRKLPLLFNSCHQVPVMARFAVFGKRRSQKSDQVKLRVMCMTEPNEKQTLEKMQQFTELARGPLVELADGDPVSISLSENLEVLTESDDASKINRSSPVQEFSREPSSKEKDNINNVIACQSTYNTRLPLLVRTKNADDSAVDSYIRFAFGSVHKPVSTNSKNRHSGFYDDCVLGIFIPEKLDHTTNCMLSQFSKVDAQNYYYRKSKITEDEDMERKNLRLTDISEQLGTDWILLAHILNFEKNQIEDIKSSFDISHEQALVFLQRWIARNESSTCVDDLEKSLKRIGRFDIVVKGLCANDGASDDIDILDFVDKEDDVTSAADNRIVEKTDFNEQSVDELSLGLRSADTDSCQDYNKSTENDAQKMTESSESSFSHKNPRETNDLTSDYNLSFEEDYIKYDEEDLMSIVSFKKVDENGEPVDSGRELGEMEVGAGVDKINKSTTQDNSIPGSSSEVVTVIRENEDSIGEKIKLVNEFIKEKNDEYEVNIRTFADGFEEDIGGEAASDGYAAKQQLCYGDDPVEDFPGVVSGNEELVSGHGIKVLVDLASPEFEHPCDDVTVIEEQMIGEIFETKEAACSFDDKKTTEPVNEEMILKESKVKNVSDIKFGDYVLTKENDQKIPLIFPTEVDRDQNESEPKHEIQFTEGDGKRVFVESGEPTWEVIPQENLQLLEYSASIENEENDLKLQPIFPTEVDHDENKSLPEEQMIGEIFETKETACSFDDKKTTQPVNEEMILKESKVKIISDIKFGDYLLTKENDQKIPLIFPTEVDRDQNESEPKHEIQFTEGDGKRVFVESGKPAWEVIPQENLQRLEYSASIENEENDPKLQPIFPTKVSNDKSESPPKHEVQFTEDDEMNDNNQEMISHSKEDLTISNTEAAEQRYADETQLSLSAVDNDDDDGDKKGFYDEKQVFVESGEAFFQPTCEEIPQENLPNMEYSARVDDEDKNAIRLALFDENKVSQEQICRVLIKPLEIDEIEENFENTITCGNSVFYDKDESYLESVSTAPISSIEPRYSEKQSISYNNLETIEPSIERSEKYSVLHDNITCVISNDTDNGVIVEHDTLSEDAHALNDKEIFLSADLKNDFVVNCSLDPLLSSEQTEPSIDHHEKYTNENEISLPRRKAVSFLLLDGNVGDNVEADLRPPFSSIFSEDNAGSFDYDNYTLKFSVRRSEDELLPDGYVLSRNTWPYQDGSGNHDSPAGGTTARCLENVFENIPGAQKWRIREEEEEEDAD